MAYDFNSETGSGGAAPIATCGARSRGEPAERSLSLEEMGKLCQVIAAAQRELRSATKGVTEEYSLGPRGAWIIGMIGKGTVFPSDLAQRLRISPSLVAAELERLVEAGLITSRKNERDARRLELALTSSGEAANARLGRDLEEMLRKRLSDYTREEILLCMRILSDFSAGEVAKLA